MDELRRRRALTLGFKLALSGLASFALFELSLRVLLFHDADWATRLGGSLRRETNFSTRWNDDYWILRATFQTGHAPPEPRRFDSNLGWLNPFVEPGTYAHQHEAETGARRPVLLYGDSYAACAGTEACWQELLAGAPLGERYHLLNYGAGGFGFDQAYLLYERSIERYAERDPVVIIGVLVDDDLDRSMLHLREWPKPHLRWTAEGGLEPEGPVVRGAGRFLEDHPPGIASYALRYLVYGAGVLPRKQAEWLIGRGGHIERTKRHNRRILEALQASLEARGLEAFVVLFQGQGYVERTDWRERFLQAELQRLGIPYVSARLRIRADRRASGLSTGDYYMQSGPQKNHFNERGNEVVFAAIADGLEGRFDGP